VKLPRVAPGVATAIGNHSFRATGITAYLKNGGTLEKAAAMANHASTRTTQLYDRRRDEMSLDEVEPLRVCRLNRRLSKFILVGTSFSWETCPDQV
jgi:integrase